MKGKRKEMTCGVLVLVTHKHKREEGYFEADKNKVFCIWAQQQPKPRQYVG
jgi:hypothetical protein